MIVLRMTIMLTTVEIKMITSAKVSEEETLED